MSWGKVATGSGNGIGLVVCAASWALEQGGPVDAIHTVLDNVEFVMTHLTLHPPEGHNDGLPQAHSAKRQRIK